MLLARYYEFSFRENISGFCVVVQISVNFLGFADKFLRGPGLIFLAGFLCTGWAAATINVLISCLWESSMLLADDRHFLERTGVCRLCIIVKVSVFQFRSSHKFFSRQASRHLPTQKSLIVFICSKTYYGLGRVKIL